MGNSPMGSEPQPNGVRASSGDFIWPESGGVRVRWGQSFKSGAVRASKGHFMWPEVHIPGGVARWLFWEGGGGWRRLRGGRRQFRGLRSWRGCFARPSVIRDAVSGIRVAGWRGVPFRGGADNDGSASHPRAATASPRLLVAAFGCYGDDPMMLDPEVAKRYHWV